MPILYKYLHPDRVDVLESGFIMLTKPRSFNDPFELNPHFDTVQEFTLPIPAGATRAQLQWIAEKQKWLNDALMPQEAREQVIENKAPTIVVLSLSEKRDSLLMWAHYAASHSGFLIGFDSEANILAIESPHRHMARVNYTTQRPTTATWEEITNEELLLTKSKEWEYEGEWRIIDSLYSADGEADQDKPDYWPFLLNPAAIKEVVVGCRSGELHKKIEKILEQPKYKHIEVLRGYKDPKEYKLNFMPVGWRL